MKVVIETLDNKKGYILTTNDGRTYTVENIDEAIKMKDELIEVIQEGNIIYIKGDNG
jgi:hypothetical protein